MNNEKLEKYNQTKLVEAFGKIISGTYTRADELEALLNGMVDLTVKNKSEREYIQASISAAKEIAEKKNNK
jgi:hypothetical protein